MNEIHLHTHRLYRPYSLLPDRQILGSGTLGTKFSGEIVRFGSSRKDLVSGFLEMREESNGWNFRDSRWTLRKISSQK
jgi:hypothetical protein